MKRVLLLALLTFSTASASLRARSNRRAVNRIKAEHGQFQQEIASLTQQLNAIKQEKADIELAKNILSAEITKLKADHEVALANQKSSGSQELSAQLTLLSDLINKLKETEKALDEMVTECASVETPAA